MVGDLPAVRIGELAAAYHAEGDAIRDDNNPWTRADTQALVWLRSPAFTTGTRDQYQRIYQSWRTWCTHIGVPPFDADRRALESYTLALEKVGNPAARNPRPLSRRSVARHMAAISSYYTRAVDDEVTDRNPVPKSGRPKVRRESRQPHLTPQEIRNLIGAADADSPRSSALVALLVLACLRISEAVSVQIEDLSWEDGTRFVWTRRKGDKGQRVPLPPEADRRVQAAVGVRKHGPVVATGSGRGLDRSNAWALIRRLGVRAGIGAPIGPHTLRHAYITRGHELHVPVADLQDAAGHESVDTTRGYDRSRFDPARHPSFLIAKDLAG